MPKPILCVDFDGVIHSYSSGWKGATVIPDPPVPGALKWLWKATEWWDVQIYSSRSKDPEARLAMQNWMVQHSLTEFGADHPMGDGVVETYPITFAYEKPAAFLTIDDRAICFEGDWSELDSCDLRNFVPWNKRPPMPKLGATGEYPDGTLGPHDEGGIQMAIAHDSKGLVHVNFGKDISWFAIPPEQAINLAKMLMHHAGAKKIEISL